MSRIAFILLILISVSQSPHAHAIQAAHVIESTSSSWLERDNKKLLLSHQTIIESGDRVITADTGQTKIELRSKATIQLNTNTEISISIHEDKKIFDEKIHLYKGRLCINTSSLNDNDHIVQLTIDRVIYSTISKDVDVCITREQLASVIKLHNGSIQITHAANLNTIILSEVGAQFWIDDKGESKLLFIDNNKPTVETTKPNIDLKISADKNNSNNIPPETDIVNPSPDTIKANPISDNIESKPQETQKYLVCVLTTRSLKSAQRLNKRLRRANYKPSIFKTHSSSNSQYQVAIPGFESIEQAKEMANTLFGQFGITETWVAKEAKSSN